MDGAQVAKWVIIAGVILVAVGAAMWIAARLGLPIGRLPGDVHVRSDRVSFHFPVVTCIVVSVVLTILLNVLLRLFK